MNQLLDTYTTYVAPAVHYLLLITVIITFFYLIRLFITLFKLSKSMKTMNSTQGIIQERINHLNQVSTGFVAHIAKKRESNKYSVSTIAIKFIRKKKVF